MSGSDPGHLGDVTQDVDIEGLGDAPVAPGSVDPEGHRHDASSFAFVPEAVQDPYVHSDARLLTPRPAAEGSGVGVEGVDSMVGKDSAELCRMIDAAKSALVTRFKAFLAKTFKGVNLDVPFGDLKFSSISGENGQSIRIEGLNDCFVQIEGEQVLFSTLCSTEGFKVNQNGNLFDLELSSAVFDGKPFSPNVGAEQGSSAFEPTRMLRVPPLAPADTGSVVSGIQARAAGIRPVDHDAPTHKIVREEHRVSPESMGFLDGEGHA